MDPRGHSTHGQPTIPMTCWGERTVLFVSVSARFFPLQSGDLLWTRIGRLFSLESARGRQSTCVPSTTVTVTVPMLRWGALWASHRCRQATLTEGKESSGGEGQICLGQMWLGSTEMLVAAET